MIFIFPHDYFNKKAPEEYYQGEFDFVKELECETILLDFDIISAGEDPFSDTLLYHDDLAVWRGWQMTSDKYAKFYERARDHGLKLINIPNQYRACHELSNCYTHIARFSISTIFANADKSSAKDVRNILEHLDTDKAFVKDTVKGQRDYPCIIESSDEDSVIEEKLAKLVEDRGDAFTGTFAFRKFVELEGETRFFILDGRPIGCGRHFSEEAGVDFLDGEQIIKSLKMTSRFFTIDMARSIETDEIVIVEAGDGQVSECPEECMRQVIKALSRA